MEDQSENRELTNKIINKFLKVVLFENQNNIVDGRVRLYVV